MTEDQKSIVFDRAADYYDATRSSTPEQTERLARLLFEETASKQPCLEVGIGTGRIAIPLAALGLPIVGIDLSRAMLEKLLQKTSNDARIPVAIADAVDLPFADTSFGCAIAAWVFHLVPNWRAAADELIRTVRPEGLILVSIGGKVGFGRGVWQEIFERFIQLVPVSNVGANALTEVDEHMVARGLSVRSIDTLPHTEQVRPADLLGRLDAGIYSFLWSIDDDIRHEAVEDLTEWSAARYGDLEQELPNEFWMEWRAYDAPG